MPERPNFPPAQKDPSGALFSEPPRERSFPTASVAVAAVAVVIVVLAFLVVGRHKAAPSPTTEQPVAAYASNLEVNGLQASESESLSGGRSTYVDGHIVNHGAQTVTGITVQAFFANDASQTPQVETAPLAIIRTREPYVDTEPLNTAPLAPGAQADFRLIFEGVNDSWNQQMPTIHIIDVQTR
jgi:hypothetical protein